MPGVQTKQRNTNLELFRIISMLLIVAHHYLVNSGMMDGMLAHPSAGNSIFFFIFGAWGKVGINCFVMITGYFMCKSSITVRKFLKLILEILFYNIAIYCVFVFTGYQAFSPLGLLKSFLPVTSVSNGFTSAFIIFYLFIPFLNILLNHLNEKMHIRLMLLCILVYTVLGTIPKITVTMNYVSWFIVIYFIASYIRLYPRKVFDITKVWALASVISLTLSVVSILVSLKFIPNSPYYFLDDSNKLLALITAFCAFMFFKNVKIPYVKVINTIASATFGVLLIHANSDTMRHWLWTDTLNNAGYFNTQWCYLHFFAAVFSIYIACTIIDLLRIYFLERPFFRLYDKASPKLYSKFNALETRLMSKLHIQ